MSRFRSLLQASLAATKRALTWNLEDLTPPRERLIFNFNSKAELKKWHLYSDSEYGGMSSASLEIKDTSDGPSAVAVKLKGDGRNYISTIYTQNWVNSPGQEEDNSWQAFVFVPKDDWYIAKIPLSMYVPTWRGNIINAKLEMNPSRVLAMALSVNAEGGVPGARSGPRDFHVEIDWIKALRTV
ncbi:unnamed protein product [Cuscuta epithymum]|uniref:NADH:ubiquinone oxidoreductase intermediate-associated protein 30 domain-containing protein n=1 Tax=Cuscuta epithymum TaxID=186058 RepID=A0AAV0DQJ5_9ASTE|nr:unnamed protein product [Cuscuta epithymum]